MVESPRLVKPRKNMRISKVALDYDKIPNILTTKSREMTISMVFPNLSLSPRKPHIKLPMRAVTVLVTRQ